MALLSRVYQSYRKLTPLMLKASDLDPERKIDYYFSIEASGRHQVTELINLSKSLRQILRIYTINIDNFSRIKSHSAKGADIGGLVGARRAGIATGGTAPRGYKTELGEKPEELKQFGLIPHPSPKYDVRTRENVSNSDLTLIFATFPDSKGTQLTIKLCKELYKPYLSVNPFCDCIEQIRNFINLHKPRVINLAGNRESKSKGIASKTAATVEAVFIQERSNV